MKKKIRLLFGVVFITALLAGAGMIVRQQMDYQKGRKDYEEAVAIMRQTAAPKEQEGPKAEVDLEEAPLPSEPEPETAEDLQLEAMKQLDWKALQQINPDVIGWIRIPDTSVDYPILQTENNSYYLDKTWKKEKSTVGSIFMECQNRADLSQFNTLLYGHNMRDGSMFSILKEYQKQEFLDQHPSIYVAVDDKVCRYDIYAVYEAVVWDLTYGLEIDDPEDREAFIQLGMEKNVVQTTIIPAVEDEVLTLSTCTGRGDAAAGKRWVVQAVLHQEP